MSDFIVVAKPRYRQVSKNGMLVRMRSQDYIDMVTVCEEANVRFCDLLHSAVRYALDHLKIQYEEEGENNGNRRDRHEVVQRDG